MSEPSRRGHLRDDEDTEHRVHPMELFFDLVFVFAVTQLSHYLLEHHDWRIRTYAAWALGYSGDRRAPAPVARWPGDR